MSYDNNSYAIAAASSYYNQMLADLHAKSIEANVENAELGNGSGIFGRLDWAAQSLAAYAKIFNVFNDLNEVLNNPNYDANMKSAVTILVVAAEFGATTFGADIPYTFGQAYNYIYNIPESYGGGSKSDFWKKLNKISPDAFPIDNGDLSPPSFIGLTPSTVPIPAVPTLPTNDALNPQDSTRPASEFNASPDYPSPLVLDLDGDGVELTKLNYGDSGSRTYFDLDNDGFAERTAWVTGGDGLLVRDLNGNGWIDNQNELFGNNATYADGFAALKALDSNNSNTITSADTFWGQLKVWIDANGDGETQVGETKTLAELGITSINLNATAQTGLYRQENLISHTSTFVRNGVTLAVEDVWFRNSNLDTIDLSQQQINVQTAFLPTLKGLGNLSDLHVEMSRDQTLLEMVEDLKADWQGNPFSNRTLFKTDVENILYRWAGIESLSPTAYGSHINAQHAEFLEKFTGKDYATSFYTGLAGFPARINAIESAYQSVLDAFKGFLVFQVGGKSIFEYTAKYNLFTGDFVSASLSQSGISSLTAKAIASGNASNFWKFVAETIFQVRDSASLNSNEISWLNSAIQASDNALSWTSISSAVLNTYIGTTITGTSFSDQLEGTLKDDTLNGQDGDDILNGNAGQDYLYGGNGNDTYIFSGGASGFEDRIYETGGSGIDIIKLPDGVVASQVTFSSPGTVLFITVSAYGTMRVQDQFGSNASYRIEKLQFSDGSFFDLLNSNLTFSGTNASETITAPDLGSTTHDTLLGYGGDDTLSGGIGNDILDGGTGVDLLYGGNGNDTYIFSGGASGFEDRIYETGGSGIDIIKLPDGVVANQITFTSSGTVMFLTVSGHGTMRVQEQFGSNTSYRVEKLQFSDGSFFDLLNSNLTFSGTNASQTITAPDLGSTTHDTLLGYGGDDTLSGGIGNDILDGGAGLDLLYGGTGSDTFYFGIQTLDGNIDKIKDYSSAQSDKIDISDLLTDYDPVTKVITNYIEMLTSGANTVIKIDRDGLGNAYTWTTIGQVDNVTGMTDEASLVQQGSLIVS